MSTPSRALRVFLLVIDVGSLAYRLVSALHRLPPQALYAHHDDPVMVARNGSSLPLDLVVSASGLSSLWLARRGDRRWSMLARLSLAFTSASGLGAVAFRALTDDFDLAWWAPNLVPMLGPWPFVVALLPDQRA